MADRGSVAAVSPVRAGPATDRLGAIDSARGLALLGIFLVNISFFSQPLGNVLLPHPGPGEGLDSQIVYYLTQVFCTGKFYAQFSMLFGIGLILQMTRVESRGHAFTPLYLRRLAFLLCLGFVHALGIWYGDILFTYAIAGTVLFFCRRMSGKAMLVISGGLLTFACLLALGFSALALMADQDVKAPQGSAQIATESAPAPPPRATPAPKATPPADGTTPNPSTEWSGSPAGRLFASFETGDAQRGPASASWTALEREAYQQGPYLQAFIFRGMSWLGIIVFELIGFFWAVLAFFFLGAGLFKVGLFEPRNIHWHRRFVVLGLTVGLPIAMVTEFIDVLTSSPFVVGAVAGAGMYIAGPLMGLMYIGLMTLAVHHGAARWLTGALANVGRMALTNYLMQSVIATSIFYWFGLGYFDQIPRTACAAIVVGIFIGQIIFSNIWMSIFRIGPMEWLWRSFTYLSFPPLFRESPGKA